MMQNGQRRVNLLYSNLGVHKLEVSNGAHEKRIIMKLPRNYVSQWVTLESNWGQKIMSMNLFSQALVLTVKLHGPSTSVLFMKTRKCFIYI